MGEVSARRQDGDAVEFDMKTELSRTLNEGDSVAVNGACLTVLNANDDTWTMRLMPETLEKTNLGELESGSVVNLEEAMRAGQKLDGHFVMGHVDAVATVSDINELESGDKIFTFSPPAEYMKYLIPKGSVALSGVSLTVVDVLDDSFTVSMMPYTLEHTSFGKSQLGQTVNIEVDLLGKYVERMLETHNE